MKTFEGKKYLSPTEASAVLVVSPKTLQRWAEAGEIHHRVKGRLEKKKIDIEVIKAPTGYRYYSAKSIEDLAEEFYPGYVRQFSPKEEPLFYEI